MRSGSGRQIWFSGCGSIAIVFAGALARRHSEESLRESEARLNLAATSAEAGLWILEIASGHIWATEKARELYGLAPGQELNFEDFIQISRLRRIALGFAAAWNRQHGRKEDFQRNTASSTRTARSGGWPRAAVRISDPSGEPERLMGVSIDISERKQMEDQLRVRLRGDRGPQAAAGKGKHLSAGGNRAAERARGDRRPQPGHEADPGPG